MLEMCTPIIFANVKILSFLKKQLNLNVNLHGIDKIEQAIIGKINVLNVWREGVNLEWGVENDVVGKYAVKSFVAATQALKEDKIDVLVTAPMSKANIQSEAFSFPGHTDYLDQELEGDALMFMVQDSLRVGLLTDHVPINEVAKHLTADVIRTKIKTINKSLIQDFGVNKPKIAVLGLNPHSGDNGVIGNEEETIVKPALKKLFDEGILVFGPFSADGFFGSGQYEKYDAVIATYHDQGLIPFKTLSFGKGVNYTAGLNKVRTSPDHGTGYDIAGKGIADATSFTEAIYMALDVFKSRNEYLEMAANPLKVREK
jgi:4-hydroxythreonine-4-phosphate dehydrogenase